MKIKLILRQTGFQARKLETDEEGNLLLDPNNPEDVEWFENDAAYDIQLPNTSPIQSPKDSKRSEDSRK